MANKIKVSVILPVYNAEKTVKKTILSILNQKSVLLELIVINDGSTDDTQIVLNEFSNKENIKIINQENKGVSYARNVGIENMSGKYCFFIDSDDFLENTALYRMLNLAQKYSLDMVCCNHKEFNSTMCITRKEEENCILASNKKEIAKNYDLFYFQSAWAKLFKSSIIKLNKIRFNTTMTLGEDLNFSLNYLIYVKEIGYIGSVNYIINNINPYSLSKRYSFGLERYVDLQSNIWEKLKSINPLIDQEYRKKHIMFDVYLLKVYFGNLFRFDSPLTNIAKIRKIKKILVKYRSWVKNPESKGKPRTFVDRIVEKVIYTDSAFLIFLFFNIKEKIRRVKFFVGKKPR